MTFVNKPLLVKSNKGLTKDADPGQDLETEAAQIKCLATIQEVDS